MYMNGQTTGETIGDENKHPNVGAAKPEDVGQLGGRRKTIRRRKNNKRKTNKRKKTIRRRKYSKRRK